MSRFHFSVIAILVLTLVGLRTIDVVFNKSLPKIELPEKAHNTIGEIPLVEHYDDGKLEHINPTQRAWTHFGTITGGISYAMISSDVAYVRRYD